MTPATRPATKAMMKSIGLAAKTRLSASQAMRTAMIAFRTRVTAPVTAATAAAIPYQVANAMARPTMTGVSGRTQVDTVISAGATYPPSTSPSNRQPPTIAAPAIWPNRLTTGWSASQTLRAANPTASRKPATPDEVRSVPPSRQAAKNARTPPLISAKAVLSAPVTNWNSGLFAMDWRSAGTWSSASVRKPNEVLISGSAGVTSWPSALFRLSVKLDQMPVKVVAWLAIIPANACVCPAAPWVPCWMPDMSLGIASALGTSPLVIMSCNSPVVTPNWLARMRSAGIPASVSCKISSPWTLPLADICPIASTTWLICSAEPPMPDTASPIAVNVGSTS